MASLASKPTEGGSLAISVAQVGVGLIAGYVIGRIARDAIIQATELAGKAADRFGESIESVQESWDDLTSLDLDIETPMLELNI